ncbi:MAG: hypothetical protein JSS06_04910, partial [Proteobacteria bacterium]|nr:hypothetical protein [Pseudomonadota bacterium]
NALQNAGDGWWCEESTSTWDGSGWVVTAGACYYSPYSSPGESGGGGVGGGVGGGAGESGGGVGGAGLPNPAPDSPNINRPDEDISSDLKCMLRNYLHPDSKLPLAKTMKRVDTWAFKEFINNNPQYGYKFSDNNNSPGPSWKPVGGISGYGNTYGRLYNAAFQAGTLKKFGTHYTGDISINESVSALEMSIFAAGHEAAHLMISNANEEMADWYGIYALKEYRKDNGNKCKK